MLRYDRTYIEAKSDTNPATQDCDVPGEVNSMESNLVKWKVFQVGMPMVHAAVLLFCCSVYLFELHARTSGVRSMSIV